MKTGRIIAEHKTNFRISDSGKEFLATVRGSFFDTDNFPKVGDNVLYTELPEDKVVIEKILPRSSSITRRSAGTGEPQVIVANVDTIFIVMGLDGDFNLSRLERYLLLAKQSAVEAIVVLNKSDVIENVEEYIDVAKTVSGLTPVYAVSALTGQNMEMLLSHVSQNMTAVLLGSSGAGKSTITNWLLQTEKQSVKKVREDDSRGRHATTSRQLFLLPNGGYLIDTPGMRELGMSGSTAEDESAVFTEIEALSRQCKFTNCDHEKSKGCAVLAAIEAEEVSERQVQNFHKLQRERVFEESKHDAELSLQEKQRKKKLHKGYGKILERKRFEKGL